MPDDLRDLISVYSRRGVKEWKDEAADEVRRAARECYSTPSSRMIGKSAK